MKKRWLLAMLISLTAFAADESPSRTHHWQLGIGPGFVSGVNAPETIADWRFGYGWRVNSDFEMAVIADWAVSGQSTDMHYFEAKLSGDYNFSQETISPFVTVDLGYASIHAHWDCLDPQCQSPEDDAAGAALGVGGGYKFFRGQWMQLGLLGKYDLVFASTRRGTPMKYSLQAVAYF